MSDLRSQLLTSSVSVYDQKFEAARKLVVELTNQNNKYQVLMDSEMNPSTIREIGIFEQQFEECQNSMKELSSQLEKLSRGIEQRGKNKKIKEMWQKETQRYQNIHDTIFQQLSQEQQQMTLLINHPSTSSPITKRFDQINNPPYQQKTRYDQEDGVQLQELTFHEPGLELENIEFDRAILQANEQDLNQMHGDVITLHKIMSDLATEVESQGQNLDIIEDLQVKTKKNLIETNKELNQAKTYGKSSTRKYIYCGLCSLATLGIIIGIIYASKQ